MPNSAKNCYLKGRKILKPYFIVERKPYKWPLPSSPNTHHVHINYPTWRNLRHSSHRCAAQNAPLLLQKTASSPAEALEKPNDHRCGISKKIQDYSLLQPKNTKSGAICAATSKTAAQHRM
ncbi:MAG: hypothetical protein ABFS09_03615 [Thermodesulfobacteriota bacterium]